MTYSNGRPGMADLDAEIAAIETMPGLPGDTRAAKEAGFLALAATARIACVHMGDSEVPIERYVLLMDEGELQDMAKELQYLLRKGGAT